MASADLENLARNDSAGYPPQNRFSGALGGEEGPGPYKNELETFQTLAGIHFLLPGGDADPDKSKQVKPANPLADIFLPSKTAKNRFRNRGLYDRVLSQDMKNRSMYTISRYIVIFLYLFQIVIAATFTALSAYHDSHRTTLTVLGAFNTVVAGILAWVTGQGMPVRFRRARNQYRECVKAIEAAERMFAAIDMVNWPPGERPDPVKEFNRLEMLYDTARLDQEANYPETQHEPASDKNKKQNEELKAKMGKKKEQLKEMEAMRRELNTLRSSTAVVSEQGEGAGSTIS